MKYQEKKLIRLSKYLMENGVDSPRKLQRILFLLRVAEIREGYYSGCFDPYWNFEAWIGGAINPFTYEYFRLYFWNLESPKKIRRIEKQLPRRYYKEIDEFFGKIVKQYLKYNEDDLTKYVQKNKEWKSCRKDLSDNEPSTKRLNENNKNFIQF